MNIDKSLKNMLGKQKKKSTINYFDTSKILKKPKYTKKQDWDGDGIPNWKDCQPRNIMRQDVIGYHGSPEADKIRKEGFDSSKGVHKSIYLGAEKEITKPYTAPRKLVNNKLEFGKQNEDNILKVRIKNETKFASHKLFLNEVNKELLKLAGYTLGSKEYINAVQTGKETYFLQARGNAIENLKRKGYRGVLAGREQGEGEHIVFYSDDVKSIE